MGPLGYSVSRFVVRAYGRVATACCHEVARAIIAPFSRARTIESFLRSKALSTTTTTRPRPPPRLRSLERPVVEDGVDVVEGGVEEEAAANQGRRAPRAASARRRSRPARARRRRGPACAPRSAGASPTGTLPRRASTPSRGAAAAPRRRCSGSRGRGSRRAPRSRCPPSPSPRGAPWRPSGSAYR